MRPAVSNIDQAMIVFAVKQPDPNLNLLDRFLVMMEYQNIETIICFNKKDIGNEEYMDYLKNIYNLAGYKVIFASATEDEGVHKVKRTFEGKNNRFCRSFRCWEIFNAQHIDKRLHNGNRKCK